MQLKQEIRFAGLESRRSATASARRTGRPSNRRSAEFRRFLPRRTLAIRRRRPVEQGHALPPDGHAVVDRPRSPGGSLRYATPQKGRCDAAIMDFLGNTWVMVGMAVVLLALIGLLIFLRTRPQDE